MFWMIIIIECQSWTTNKSTCRYINLSCLANLFRMMSLWVCYLAVLTWNCTDEKYSNKWREMIWSVVTFPSPHEIFIFDILNDIRTRDIWAWLSSFTLTRFSPRYASGGAMCLWVETTVFFSANSLVLNLCIISSPDMSLDHWYGLLNIYGPPGSITPMSLPILTMSSRYDPTR